MKKFLLIAALGIFAACNERAAQTQTTVDSTADAISDSLGSRGDSLSSAVDSTSLPKTDSVQKR
jgi:hypothetical protein